MVTKTTPIDPSFVPSVNITHIPATSPLSEILSIIERDGCVILDDFVSLDVLDTIEGELKPYKESTLTTYDLYNDGFEFSSKENKTLTGVVAKSGTLAELVENHPVLDEVRTSILHEERDYFLDDQPHKMVIPPILSAGLRVSVTKGGSRQALHRDDQSHLTRHDYGENFDLSRAKQLGVMVAATNASRENGATLVIPGSHKWPDSRAPKLDEITFSEMSRGSALFFLASVFHGSGANTLPDPRDLYIFFFCRGHMRQEENAFLTFPQSKVLNMSKKMLSLLGYERTGSGLGQVNNEDPAANLAAILTAVNA